MSLLVLPSITLLSVVETCHVGRLWLKVPRERFVRAFCSCDSFGGPHGATLGQQSAATGEAIMSLFSPRTSTNAIALSCAVAQRVELQEAVLSARRCRASPRGSPSPTTADSTPTRERELRHDSVWLSDLPQHGEELGGDVPLAALHFSEADAEELCALRVRCARLERESFELRERMVAAEMKERESKKAQEESAAETRRLQDQLVNMSRELDEERVRHTAELAAAKAETAALRQSLAAARIVKVPASEYPISQGVPDYYDLCDKYFLRWRGICFERREARLCKTRQGTSPDDSVASHSQSCGGGAQASCDEHSAQVIPHVLQTCVSHATTSATANHEQSAGSSQEACGTVGEEHFCVGDFVMARFGAGQTMKGQEFEESWLVGEVQAVRSATVTPEEGDMDSASIFYDIEWTEGSKSENVHRVQSSWQTSVPGNSILVIEKCPQPPDPQALPSCSIRVGDSRDSNQPDAKRGVSIRLAAPESLAGDACGRTQEQELASAGVEAEQATSSETGSACGQVPFDAERCGNPESEQQDVCAGNTEQNNAKDLCLVPFPASASDNESYEAQYPKEQRTDIEFEFEEEMYDSIDFWVLTDDEEDEDHIPTTAQLDVDTLRLQMSDSCDADCQKTQGIDARSSGWAGTQGQSSEHLDKPEGSEKSCSTTEASEEDGMDTDHQLVEGGQELQSVNQEVVSAVDRSAHDGNLIWPGLVVEEDTDSEGEDNEEIIPEDREDEAANDTFGIEALRSDSSDDVECGQNIDFEGGVDDVDESILELYEDGHLSLVEPCPCESGASFEACHYKKIVDLQATESGDESTLETSRSSCLPEEPSAMPEDPSSVQVEQESMSEEPSSMPEERKGHDQVVMQACFGGEQEIAEPPQALGQQPLSEQSHDMYKQQQQRLEHELLRHRLLSSNLHMAGKHCIKLQQVPVWQRHQQTQQNRAPEQQDFHSQMRQESRSRSSSAFQVRQATPTPNFNQRAPPNAEVAMAQASSAVVAQTHASPRQQIPEQGVTRRFSADVLQRSPGAVAVQRPAQPRWASPAASFRAEVPVPTVTVPGPVFVAGAHRGGQSLVSSQASFYGTGVAPAGCTQRTPLPCTGYPSTSAPMPTAQRRYSAS